ncbi:MAG: VWA domain-containing protein, partial [Actinomycetia bacterium]|nr:VWA domain-containing protein [Actinomycetes bacterium]
EVENNPTAYQVVVGNGEYFLIENRQAVGFDQNLHTCGLAIWHVDQATVEAQAPLNRVNRRENCGIYVQIAGQHYGLALEQADGQCDLEADLNRGDDGDLYPGSSGSTSFTTATFPDSDSYVSGPTLVEVTNISACGSTMTADVDAVPIPPTTGPVDVVFLIDNTGSYANDWPNIQAQMPDIVTKLSTNFADIRYGLALFRDFPFTPFGGASDFAYQEELPLTTNSAAFSNAIANLQSP